jgi:metal-dependent hydrolase (beta-lactamase superfamily II)
MAAAVLHDVESAIEIDLEPVDSVVVTTLMDNVTDIFMPDQGPARRAAVGAGPWCPSAVMEGGQAPDVLLAEHGFSVLVTVAKGAREHRFLFDTGTSPDGVTHNMRHLDIDPSSIEAIVCSHGHFDHTTGLDGLIRALRRVNMPVLIHPHFWRRRRIALPGREPMEIPTTSRRALNEAGFDIIEEQQPSFMFGRSVLITGEVARTTGYEPGFPPQQAWLDGRWQPRSPRARRPGAHSARQRPRTGGDHRLRSRRSGQHRPLYPAAVRRRAAVRAAGRLSPERPDLRAADPARPRRTGRDEPRRARPGSLHGLAGPARHICPLPRGLHSQFGRQQLSPVTRPGHGEVAPAQRMLNDVSV